MRAAPSEGINRQRLLSMYKNKNSGTEMAAYFGVSRRTIVRIIGLEREKNPEVWGYATKRGES